MKTKLHLILVTLGLAALSAAAQVPGIISHQGKVTVNGTNYTGSGLFRFALVDAGGTTTYWSQDGSSTGGAEPASAVTLPATRGVFSVNLGDTTVANMTQAIPASVFTNSAVYLRVWFNDGPDGSQLLSPDRRITSVGYALAAASLTGPVALAQLPAAVLTNGASGVNLSGTFTGDGGGLTNLNLAQGPQGISGTNGVKGTNGLDGATGPQGPTGLTGNTGLQGTIGLTGDTGPQGLPGVAGLDGTNGVNGTHGLDGAAGPQGTTGLSGVAGPQGLTGATGAQGLQGVAGLNGTNGVNGTNGLDGATGPQGTTGATGAQGLQGVAGLNGTNGVNGTNGLNGATGATGPAGPLFADVVLVDTNQTFTGSNTFSGVVLATNANNRLTGIFTGNGAGLTNLPAAAAAPPGMVLIPAGSFTMGDPLDGLSDAVPTSTTVSAFYMDVNLVSWSQWQSVYYWATNHGYGFGGAGAGKAANHPVQTVKWYDCVKWCNARSQQAGKTPVYYTDVGLTAVYTNGEVTVYANWTVAGYRLPTEAEWEKAARGGLSGQRFPWGNVINQNLANYDGNTSYAYDLGPNGYNAIGNYPTTSPGTSPVGSFAANGYGLNDMAGNTWEWCWDWYGTPYAGGSDPHGPAGQLSNRVLRGGTWSWDAYYCRAANRNYDFPTNGYITMGFRSVLPPGQ
jgi:formylglycine-generating enzyme required for sulfatase activity